MNFKPLFTKEKLFKGIGGSFISKNSVDTAHKKKSAPTEYFGGTAIERSM